MENWPFMDASLYEPLWRELLRGIRGLREAMGEPGKAHNVPKIFASASHLVNGFDQLMKHVTEYMIAWEVKQRSFKLRIEILTQKLEASEARGNAARADPENAPLAAEATISRAERADKAEVDIDVKPCGGDQIKANPTGAERQPDPAGFPATRSDNPQAEARCAQKCTNQSKNKTSKLHPVPASEIETRILRSGSKQPLRRTISMETELRPEGSCDQSSENTRTTEKTDSDLAQNPPLQDERRKCGRLSLREIPSPFRGGDPLVTACNEARRITPDESGKRGTATAHQMEKTTSFEQVETPLRACHKRPLDFVFLNEGREERPHSPSNPTNDGGKQGDYDKERATVDEICGMMAKYTQGFRQKLFN